jgi:hypothetical protein
MPKENTAQTSWKYGEISPLLRGRIDTEAWKQGAETLENFVVTPQGGLLRRPGTEHMLSISSPKVKLINFRSSDDNSYIIQLIDNLRYAQILKNGAILKGPNGQRIENVVDNGAGLCRVTITDHGFLVATTVAVQEVTGATGANGNYTASVIDGDTLDLAASVMGGLTYTGGGMLYASPIGTTVSITNATYAAGEVEITATSSYSAGASIGIAGVRGFEGINGQWVVSSFVSITKFKIAYSGTVSAYTSGGAVSSDYCVIPAVNFFYADDVTKTGSRQSADVMFLVNPTIRPQVLSRYAENEWECRDFKQSDGPYLDRNSTHIRLGITGLSDTATFEDTQPGASTAHTAIANAAGLFRITSNAHGLANGDRIRITGVTNYPAANGYWAVQGVAANTFDLTGSAFAGGGAVDGTWKRVVYFVAGDVGKYLQFREDNLWKLAKVTAYTSATKVTCDILGNLMLDIDPTVNLSRKSSVTATVPVSRNEADGNGTQQQYNPRKYIPGQIGHVSTRLRTKKHNTGFDPATGISFAAAVITSDHAGTFSKYDVGKFVKTSTGGTPNTWYLVTSFTSTTSVGASAATRIAGANETTERGLVYYNRSITSTVTSSAPNAVDPSIFSSSDVGRHIRFNFTGVSVWCEITAYTSQTVVSVKFFQDLPVDTSDSTKISDNGIVEDWQLGAWSDDIGWPETIEIHEQRLVFGGNAKSPQTVWTSISGDYWNFAPTEPDGTVLDDSAITYTIASEDVNSIVWMISAKVLLIGTLGGEWQARAATSVSEPMTPTNISVTPQSSWGSQSGHKAQRIGNSIFFLQRSGTRLRKMSFDYNSDGFASSDVSIASEHMMRNGRKGKSLAYQATPFQVLWIVLDDGSLASVTINEDENQYSFSHHTLGQYQTCVASDVVAITKDDGTFSRIYLVTSRNNSSNLEIERIGEFWMPSADTARASLTVPFMDSFATRTLSSSSTAQPNGLVPNGATVQAVINGTTYITGTISGGVLALGGTYSGTCYIGYGYTTRLKMLPPEGGSAFGTAMAKTKRVNRVGIRHFSSYKFKHGPSTTSLTSRTIPDTATNFFTGDDKFELNSPYGLESGYVIQVDEPWPIGILAVAPELKTNE